MLASNSTAPSYARNVFQGAVRTCLQVKGAEGVEVLHHPRPSLAVAQGATFFAKLNDSGLKTATGPPFGPENDTIAARLDRMELRCEVRFIKVVARVDRSVQRIELEIGVPSIQVGNQWLTWGAFCGRFLLYLKLTAHTHLQKSSASAPTTDEPTWC